MQKRRKTIIINRKFQFKFTFFVCSWIFAISVVYPLVIYRLFDYFVSFSASISGGVPSKFLLDTRTELIWLLVFFQLVFVAVTFLISLFVSHRIAGPLYKMQQFFHKVRGGKFGDHLKFRKSDHFKELADDYNEMMESVQDILTQKTRHVLGLLTQAENTLHRVEHKDEELEKVLDELKDIRESCLRDPSPEVSNGNENGSGHNERNESEHAGNL